MQINSSTNYNAAKNHNPEFGSIKLYGGADDVLKKVLKPEEWLEFREIAVKAAKNTEADAIFWGYGSKKLTGRAVSTDSMNAEDYSQRLFEKPLSFIKRVCKKADLFSEKIREKQKINFDVDELLDNLK